MRVKGEIKYSVVRYDNMNGSWTKVSNDIYKLTNGNSFKIYCFLCSLYDKTRGYSFPSLNYIAKETNISRPTVVKCIKELEEDGLIKVLKFENKTSKYTNNIYKIFVPNIIYNEVEEKLRQQEEEERRKIDEEIDKEIKDKIHSKEIEYEINEHENK